jgi:hypothetical protein
MFYGDRGGLNVPAQGSTRLCIDILLGKRRRSAINRWT